MFPQVEGRLFDGRDPTLASGSTALLHDMYGKMNKEEKMLHIYVKINELKVIVGISPVGWEEISYHLVPVYFFQLFEVLFTNKIIRYFKCTL